MHRARGALLSQGAAAAASHASLPCAAIARGVSDFSYVTAGRPAPRRHVLRFRERERDEEWRHAGLPIVESGMPEAARGRVVEFYLESVHAADAELMAATAADPRAPLVHIVLSHVGPEMRAQLSAAELAEVTAPLSDGELAALAAPAARHRALLALRSELEALQTAAAEREEDALDSGEADLALPLAPEQRAELQAVNSRELLLAALRAARGMGALQAALAATLSPAQRAALGGSASGGAEEGDTIAAHMGVATPTQFQALGAGAGDVVAPGDEEMTPEELRGFNHADDYATMALQALQNRDRLAPLPRKRLPTPLHADAPSPHLEDVARLIDANPSYTSENDKAYVMHYYAAALDGADVRAMPDLEKAAFFDPQPQWGVYDPEEVKTRDNMHDAVQGKGAFSRTHGSLFANSLVPAASIGPASLNPKGELLTGTEEVARIMGAYDEKLAREVAATSAAVNDMLERTMGLPQGRLAKAAPKPGGQTAALAAARAKQQPPAGGKQPARISDDVAEGAIKSFFKKYTAGEATHTPPAPPLTGPRAEMPAPAAAPADPKGGKKKGKK